MELHRPDVPLIDRMKIQAEVLVPGPVCDSGEAICGVGAADHPLIEVAAVAILGVETSNSYRGCRYERMCLPPVECGGSMLELDLCSR